uniref:Uncharacterized protein n=1 Tax=Neobodo designis TaxID=312471 RepID=A0A7S1LUA3_NEODS
MVEGRRRTNHGIITEGSVSGGPRVHTRLASSLSSSGAVVLQTALNSAHNASGVRAPRVARAVHRRKELWVGEVGKSWGHKKKCEFVAEPQMRRGALLALWHEIGVRTAGGGAFGGG